MWKRLRTSSRRRGRRRTTSSVATITTPTAAQKAKIKQTAQAILDARALYPDASLADLYDELTMPSQLRTAHQQNDRAVMQAYGFSVRDMTESTCVAALMKMYQRLTEEKE